MTSVSSPKLPSAVANSAPPAAQDHLICIRLWGLPDDLRRFSSLLSHVPGVTIEGQSALYRDPHTPRAKQYIDLTLEACHDSH